MESGFVMVSHLKVTNAIRQYQASIGAKGGRVMSPRKRLALSKSIVKAQAALAKRRSIRRKLYTIPVESLAIVGNAGGAVE